jgi:pimeloyl-ACP methyl ester carboxylesterase
MDRSDRIETFEITVAGRRLAARRIHPPRPNGDGATLVFLHEGLGSIGQWRDFPERLVERTGLPALLYDRWGYGGSDPLTLPRPRDYLEREAEESLPTLLDAAGIERPLLIGHSDGGSIALLFAAAHPEVPVAAITEAAHVFVEEETLDGIREAEAVFRDKGLLDRLARYHGAKTESVFRAWTETWQRDDFRDWNMVARLGAITCPLLVMQGAGDQYGTPLQVETIVGESAGPAEACLVPDCGHAPHLEKPEEVLNIMADYIDRIVVGGRRAGEGPEQSESKISIPDAAR